MLELLTRYAHEHRLEAEPGFAPKVVKWSIRVTGDGRFVGVLELGDAGAKNNRGHTFPCCPELSQPEIKRGGSGTRHFLVDSAEVVALHHKDPDAKLRAKHAYFVRLLDQASAVMPELAAAARCLRDEASLAEIQARLTELKARPADNVTVSIAGLDPPHPVESSTWHDWWRDFRGALGGGNKPQATSGEPGGATMRCLASGEMVTPALTHPKIKGLADVGGLAQGDVLASFKQDAFRSYGLLQSANAAVSEAKAAEYRAALNELIAHGSHRLTGARVVHWFKKRVAVGEDPLAFLVAFEDSPEETARDRARRLLRGIERGERPDLRDNYYYVLTVSGASGRVMVRDWMEGQFEELVRAVSCWFDHLSIVRRDGSGLAPDPKFLAVLGALVRDLKDVPAPVEAATWRTAVNGSSVPVQLLAMAQARTRVGILTDEPFNHARMGLLKAYHVRQGDKDMKPHLYEEHPSAAYQCGRLMAVLAALQYSALGDVGAGVVQRYYAAASATPALVLGRLVRTSQFHLEKLKNPRLKSWYQNKIAGIMARIDDMPPTLDLVDQSRFALGYYQQIAADRARRSDDQTANDTEITEENPHA
jgi:CRISPR-associated protein Csd1